MRPIITSIQHPNGTIGPPQRDSTCRSGDPKGLPHLRIMIASLSS